MYCNRVVLLLVLIITSHKSFAKPGYGTGDQEWGYVDVREGAHMFFWLYKTTAEISSATERPLVIWLEGGPGDSSTGTGNFRELGPMDVNGNYRYSTWVKEVNVLFIDSPVGSGFSYVDNADYLTMNNSQIALDLVECMKSFFNKYEEFEDVPLHIFSESYGGKMAPEFALELYNANQRGEIKCKLVSVALGNPFTSPIDSISMFAPYLLYTGVIDEDGYNDIMTSTNSIAELAKKEQWKQAFEKFLEIVSNIKEISYNVDYYNILKPVDIDDSEYSNEQDAMPSISLHNNADDLEETALTELMRGPVSEALGIPANVSWGSQFSETYLHLSEDFLKPAFHIVSELLHNTDLKVGVYSGQLDLICTTAGALKWIKKLEWTRSDEFVSALRKPISVNNILEGYEKSGGNFYMFWVNRGGHYLIPENTAAMSYILKKFTQFG